MTTAPPPTAAKAKALKASTGVDSKVTAASRANKINMMWEVTQAGLAISLTAAAIFTSTTGEMAVPGTLENALFVVLGFYFGRTNHTRPTPGDPTGFADEGAATDG